MTATEVGLPPELMAQVRGLTADQREALRDVLDELGAPPTLDWDEIRRRSDDVHAGRVALLTPEQVEQNVRATLRKYGMSL